MNTQSSIDFHLIWRFIATLNRSAGEICLWKVDLKELAAQWSVPSYQVVWHPNSQWLTSIEPLANQVAIYDVINGSEVIAEIAGIATSWNATCTTCKHNDVLSQLFYCFDLIQ